MIKNLSCTKIFQLIYLLTLSSFIITSDIVYAGQDHKITICHYPGDDIANPQTILIDRSEWNTHRTQHGDANHRDTPGACGILAGEGCFAESMTFYGLSDDYDGIAVYKLDSSETIGLTPQISFPDELENLTGSQSETFYSLKSVSSGTVGLYEITLKQRLDGSFSGAFWKVVDMEAGNFNSLELINGDFYTANNKENQWIKFSLDGSILAERSFASSMASIPSDKRNKNIEDTAYDPVNKILYASQVWDSYKNNHSHLLAFDLSNGFENMVAIDKGTIYWEKIEGLLFKDGVLYGAAGHDDKIFKIIQDENGNIVGDGKGIDVPGFDSTMSADIEGLANAFFTKDCPDNPPLQPVDFGSQGRFNFQERN